MKTLKERSKAMLYVTGIHALNLECGLNTCGDWHTSAIQWENPTIMESDGSIFGEYGIEKNRTIPEHSEKYNVANHIRALLDLIQSGNFSLAQGMKNDYICCDEYNDEIFSQVYKLNKCNNWDKINDFMEKEYNRSWRIWKSKNSDA